MVLEAGQEAMEVFKASGQAVRFLMSERWQVTNYALAAYVAVVVTPELISKNRHRSQIGAGPLCAARLAAELMPAIV